MTGEAAQRGPTVLRAGALMDAGLPERALAELAAVERDEGESIPGLRVRALALLALDRTDAARDAARRAVELAPGDSTSLRILSTALLRCGDRTEAVDAARRSVAADPGSWQAHTAVADALWLGEQNRLEALRASFEAIRLAPTEPLVHRRHGDLLLAAGRRQDAQAAYRRGLELAPEDRGARHNLAVTRLRHGHEGESALVFAGILSTDPTNATALRNLMVGVVNPLGRIRTVLGAAALFSGFEYLATIDSTAPGVGRWAAVVMPVLALAGVTFVVLRFTTEARPRLAFLVSVARRTVPGWGALAVTLGVATAISLTGLFLPPVGALAAQGLVFVGVVVASVRIRRILQAFPRTRPTPAEVEADDDDR
ncbi:tetratricopeptide repeat protein [Curtobacterium sp. VKM Ac-1393]|uniref:tetratricopeptide repeat protein n=1 Tax=Curtobacterium sp. VKM Ac-1393 TaxID=2783814 RepID=UPI00188DBC91|nr:tetratricopeptide repeat protein [Curtobacterium sp. VKM Ac-1393]MBF4608536.1 tetratricopeptide repeat protein [Curtobacterium sp. VKM Ac-1393]